MNKKSKYALRGALIFGAGNALINAFKQLDRMDKDPNLEFDWWKLLGAGAKGAAVGGVGGFAIGALADYENSLEEPVNIDAFFTSLVGSVRLSKDSSDYRRLDEKAAHLIELLKKRMGEKLAGEPSRLGSTENGTALADNFDIDICLPFRSDSFRSTSEMFSYVKNCLENLVGKQSVIDTREQKKSIGVIFNIRGKKHRIDVVPFKLTGKKDNKTSGYLYVNDAVNPSYTKTDIQALKSLKLTETQKKIVVVLKHWKIKYNVPISSHLLQNLVMDAYERNHVPRELTKKVIMVLNHIKDKMDIAVIRSIENTNNILTNISDEKKNEIVRACKKVIDEYEYQPNSIIDIFEAE